MTDSSRERLEAEIRRLAPFNHNVELPHGLRTFVPEMNRRDGERTRVANLIDHAFPALLDRLGGSMRGLRVLDVACNCGGFSVAAVKHGADQVLGIDVVDRYLEQAEFIRQSLGLSNVEYRRLPIEQVSRDSVGVFDVTFCFGILYHLENPVDSMKRIAAVTRRMLVVDTNIARRRLSRAPVWMMNVAPAASSESTDATTSLWRTSARCQFTPSAAAVVALLEFLGFDDVVRLPAASRTKDARYRKGDRATFLAVRTRPLQSTCTVG